TTACQSANSTDDVAHAMHRAVHRIHVVPIAHA
ncbi:glycosyltransferase family 9 protein, partial [Burkholderia pseudomallei]